MIAREIFSIVIGYFLGSIPFAYIAAWLTRGKDIRRIGGGNVGALNTMREVGKLPASFVVIFDMGKGAASIAIAYWALDVPALFVMLAGLASVIGHIWMIFLKFSGGRGMGAAVGSIVTTAGIYGEWTIIGIFLAFIAVPLFITRNVPVSMATALLSLPFLAWLIAHSELAIVLSIILILIVGGKFLPTAVSSWKRSEGLKNFIFHDSNPPNNRNNGV